MNKEVTITTKQIKQAIDDLVDERDGLQDKVYKLQAKVNQLETNRDEAIECIKKHFEKEYKKPREELKKYNLKNCTYDIGLIVLGILERGKE